MPDTERTRDSAQKGLPHLQAHARYRGVEKQFAVCLAMVALLLILYMYPLLFGAKARVYPEPPADPGIWLLYVAFFADALCILVAFLFFLHVDYALTCARVAIHAAFVPLLGYMVATVADGIRSGNGIEPIVPFGIVLVVLPYSFLLYALARVKREEKKLLSST